MLGVYIICNILAFQKAGPEADLYAGSLLERQEIEGREIINPRTILVGSVLWHQGV